MAGKKQEYSQSFCLTYDGGLFYSAIFISLEYKKIYCIIYYVWNSCACLYFLYVCVFNLYVLIKLNKKSSFPCGGIIDVIAVDKPPLDSDYIHAVRVCIGSKIQALYMYYIKLLLHSHKYNYMKNDDVRIGTLLGVYIFTYIDTCSGVSVLG